MIPRRAPVRFTFCPVIYRLLMETPRFTVLKHPVWARVVTRALLDLSALNKR